MDKNLLVEIFAEFGSDDGEGRVSTGYPIAKDRILTARHGLYDANDSLARRVMVRWYYQRIEEGCNWQDAEIVDCGLAEVFDVELLKCTFPDHINPNIYFVFNNPNEGIDWESEGFAAAGKRDGIRPPIPLAGEAYHSADGADWLQLTEKGKAAVPDLWRGISGAPVFIKNSNKLMGVIVECPKNFNAKRLYATPLWKLADNTQFRNEIAKERELDKPQIRQDLKAILNESPKLKDTLARELRSLDKDLINTLLGLQADELLKHCEQAISKLKQDKDQVAISKGKALVNYLLPIVFDRHTIGLICSQSQFGICRVEVGSKTVAEIVMAGKDGRVTKYRPTEKDEYPVGVYLLDSPSANHGISTENWVTDFKRQIVEDFARLDELAVGQELSSDEMLALAVDELEYYVKDKRTYYYLYSAPKDAAESAELVKVINKLHKEFNGHVVFIECCDIDVIRKERRNINRPLKKILQTEVEETS